MTTTDPHKHLSDPTLIDRLRNYHWCYDDNNQQFSYINTKEANAAIAELTRPSALVEQQRQEIERLHAFTPTSENINALPDRLRTFIHDLETRCDPAGDVAALTLTQDQNRMLQKEIERLSPKWIPTSERLPTGLDTDRFGYVLVWNFEDAREERANIITVLNNPEAFPHWLPITRPEGPKEGA